MLFDKDAQQEPTVLQCLSGRFPQGLVERPSRCGSFASELRPTGQVRVTAAVEFCEGGIVGS